MSGILGIHHVCMKVKDVAKSVEFYTQNLDYEVRLRWDGGAMLKGPDGVHLEFFPEDEQKSYAHVAYICEDVDKTYAKALETGCEAVQEPRDVTIPSQPPLPLRCAFFKDPQGNLIELFREYPV